MRKSLVILLFVLPALICTFIPARNIFANAEDETEDELVDVDNEDGSVVSDDAETETEDEPETTKSPNADTYLLFTKPLYTPGQQFELPAGQVVEFLVGFANKGEEDFLIESVEASFRYPMDFNYFIQNFSAIPYNKEVKSGQEATVSYSFLPSDSFAGRPFGLNIALNYRDSNNGQFSEAVFNETVQLIEIDEGLDGETFFLYVILAGIVILLLVLGQQYLVGSVGKRKRAQSSRKTIETGTANSNNVDYDWLPPETLRTIQKSSPKNKTPKTSPKPTPKTTPKPKPQSQQSPRQRKAKRADD